MRTRVLPLGLLAAALASPVLAQPAPKAPAQPPGPAPAQTTSPVTTSKADEDEPIPPVQPATKVLSSWREAVRLASAENPDYSIALFEIERQKGIERQVLAGVLPTITATGTLQLNAVQSDITSFDPDTLQPSTVTVPSRVSAVAQVQLHQSIISPRIWWGIGTAKRQVDVAKISLEDKKRVLIAGVADAIVTEVTAERQAEVNRVSYKASQDRLRLMKKRKELGAGSDLDIVRFQQDLVLARAQLVQGDESLRQARERLGLALGSTQDWSVRPDISIDDIESTLTRVCEKGDLADRADLRVLAKNRDIAARAITDADLLYLPSVDLFSTLTYSSDDLIGDKNYNFSIQGVLTVPIWDGGERYGIRRSAVAIRNQQQEQLEAATRSATVEVTQARRAVSVAKDTLDIAQATRDLAAQTDLLVRRAFAEGGNVTSFDLVDAARSLREAELQLTLRELDLVRAKISAVLATSNCKGI